MSPSTRTFTSIALHFGVAFSVMFAFTGQIAVSGAVAVVEPILCHFAHEAHDWVWESIRGEPAHARAVV